MFRKDWSSVMIGRFKRQGGEGEFTKIINEENKSLYANILTLLKEQEKGLIICFRNEDDWSLLTNQRLIIKPGPNDIQYEIEHLEGSMLVNKRFTLKSTPDYERYEISLLDLTGVYPGILLERHEGLSISRFSRLILRDKEGKWYISKSEAGAPARGLYQTLWYMQSASK